MSLPAVFREIAKLILFAEANGDIRFDTKLRYLLAVALDPAGTVVDFFARRAEVEPLKEAEIRAAAREVRDTYATFEGWDDDRVETLVMEAMPLLELHLLRPTDLDEWLGREPSVSTTFFRQRVVVDNEIVNDGFASIHKVLSGLVGDVKSLAPVTDEDLKVLRELIEGTPEDHRVNIGIAMLFGFPREMFASSVDLKERAERLARVLREITDDYTDWVFALARTKADEICNGAEAAYAPPIARLMPAHFLSLVAKECLNTALSSKVMSEIAAKVFGDPVFDSDEARLAEVRRTSLADWTRYLAGDFTQLMGNSEDVAFKRAIIAQGLVGIQTPQDIEHALDDGLNLLKPKMLAAADALRSTCKHKTSVVLTGTRAMDSEGAIKRLADTVRALDALKNVK